MFTIVGLLALLGNFIVLIHAQNSIVLIGITPITTLISYYNATFSVQTSNGGLPVVTCSLTCPGQPVSSVTAQLVSPLPNYIPVPVPNYTGTCTATVTATDYVPASRAVAVQNYTACSNIVGTGGVFDRNNPFTTQAAYLYSGRLGFFSVAGFKVESNDNLLASQVTGVMTPPTGSPITFFKSSCAQLAGISMIIQDSGPNPLSDCADYNNTAPVGKFYPYAPFNSTYGIQAQGTYTMTVTTDSANSGTVLYLSTRYCLSANYIVVQLAGSTIPPDYTITFDAFVGVKQSMDLPVIATIDCGGGSTTTASFTISSTSSPFTMDTPTAATGTQCTLSVVQIGVNPSLYAAPSLTYVTVEPYSLLLTVPSTTVTANGLMAYTVYSPDAPEAVASVTMKFYCNTILLGSQTVLISTQTQYFQVPSNALGSACQFQAFADTVAFTDSNAVAITAYQQLVVSSSLNGWVSGETVNVDISSPILQTHTITLTTSCSLGGFSGSITTSVASLYSIPSNINGVQCALTTTDLPAYYLPIQNVFVNIALNAAQQLELIRLLNPEAFIDATAEQRKNQQQQPPQKTIAETKNHVGKYRKMLRSMLKK